MEQHSDYFKGTESGPIRTQPDRGSSDQIGGYTRKQLIQFLAEETKQSAKRPPDTIQDEEDTYSSPKGD